MFGIGDAVSDDPIDTVGRWRRSGREPMSRWIAAVERADGVIINGEGSMIFTAPSRLEQRFHLAVMRLAYELQVPFTYVNALVADPAHGSRNPDSFAATAELLPHAQAVTTRDPWSYEFVRRNLGAVDVSYVPDAVFSWYGRVGPGSGAAPLTRPEYLMPFHERPDWLGRWDFGSPYVCVGGSSEAAKNPERATVAYRSLLAGLQQLGYPIVVTVSCLGDTFLEKLAHEFDLPLVPARTNVLAAAEILANAELVVTGRYHPAILSGLGGVPCVLLGADSHKTTSVQEMLGYPEVRTFPEYPSSDDVQAIVATSRRVLEDRPRWRQMISTAAANRASEARGLGDRLAAFPLAQIAAK